MDRRAGGARGRRGARRGPAAAAAGLTAGRVRPPTTPPTSDRHRLETRDDQPTPEPAAASLRARPRRPRSPAAGRSPARSAAHGSSTPRDDLAALPVLRAPAGRAGDRRRYRGALVRRAGRRCRPSRGRRAGAYRLICHRCGAQTDSDNLSDTCPFCGAPIVAETAGGDQIAPEAVVPFGIDRGRAQDAVRGWVRHGGSRPTSLKKVGATEQMHGTYIPHWTFDAQTATDYSGMRGEHYWETETYTENGETRTRQVMRTAWYPARRSRRARLRRRPRARLDPARPPSGWTSSRRGRWSGPSPYQPDYLPATRPCATTWSPTRGCGPPSSGWSRSSRATAATTSAATSSGCLDGRPLREVMFKLVLLPIWIAAYLTRGRTYQVFVNAHTGEVVGERPVQRPQDRRRRRGGPDGPAAVLVPLQPEPIKGG